MEGEVSMAVFSLTAASPTLHRPVARHDPGQSQAAQQTATTQDHAWPRCRGKGTSCPQLHHRDRCPANAQWAELRPRAQSHSTAT